MQIEQIDNNEYPATETPSAPIPVSEVVYSPDNPPWGVLQGIGVWLVSVAFIVIFPVIFLVPYLLNQHIELSGEVLRDFTTTDQTAIILQIASVIPAHIFTILLGWAVATRINKYSFRQMLGWTNGGMRWWHYCIIIGGFYILAVVIGSIFPEQENDLLRILRSSRAAVYIIAFMATFSAPLVEEVVYRGILFSAFQRAAGVVPAILFVTLAFAGVHFAQYWGSPGTIILICMLSLALTLVRYKTKSLWPCIVLHTLINGFQSLLLVLQPYLPKEEPAAFFHFLK
jgi:uncharacterized protein